MRIATQYQNQTVRFKDDNRVDTTGYHLSMIETLPHLPITRAREESDPESDSDNMDSQHAQNVTATQALDDGNESHEYAALQLAPPLNPEHAALRSDLSSSL